MLLIESCDCPNPERLLRAQQVLKDTQSSCPQLSSQYYFPVISRCHSPLALAFSTISYLTLT